MADWTEKYRPETLSEVRGNDKARDKLQEWADTWDDHREAVILHGSPGVGKTSAAHALASDMGWPTMEMNASDVRSRDLVDRIAGEASKSGTLDQAMGESPGRRLVILDEADNLNRNADRGGARAMTEVVKEANQPIVLIANDYYGMSDGVKRAAQDIEFRDVSARSIVPALRNICREEGIEYDEEALRAIAEQTSGDLRSAVKDLQAMTEGRSKLTEEDVVSSERDREKGIFEFMDLVLKEGDARESLYASYDVDETPDDLINWIEDNLPKVYDDGELARAYEHLAAADRWLGRVRATQEYSYWKYAGDNMTAGVAAAREGNKGGWTRWGAPSYWSKLGSSRSTRDTRDAIARRIAERAGTSVGTARREIMPFLATMTHHCKPRELTVAMAARYELDATEVSFVTGSGKDTNKVESIVEDAEARREAAAVEGTGGAFTPRAGEEESEDADPEDAAEEGAEADGTTGSLDDFAGDAPADDAATTGSDDVTGDTGATGDDGDEAADDDGTADDDGAEDDIDDRAENAEDDDGQSGLGDFM